MNSGEVNLCKFLTEVLLPFFVKCDPLKSRDFWLMHKPDSGPSFKKMCVTHVVYSDTYFCTVVISLLGLAVEWVPICKSA